MKKLTILMTLLLLAIGMVHAKGRHDDFSGLRDMSNTSYVQAQGGMLKSGLFLSQYGVYSGMTQDLTKLQILTISADSSDLNKCREEVRKIASGMDIPFDMKSNRSNIVVWGNADKDDVYHRVIIGIGTSGKLTYILMEGDITGTSLGAFLSNW